MSDVIPDSLLDRPAGCGPLATIDQPVSEGPGTVIGPYKLLEQIGEGVFGIVFMAEQSEPVRRKVPLKVLKPGIDSRQVVARFEAERQALAIMDHPNIARVFDGGATAFGRLYFVMELVRGVPITDFCDQNHLTPRQRLELFVPICQAVQHAHQKGIIRAARALETPEEQMARARGRGAAGDGEPGPPGRPRRHRRVVGQRGDQAGRDEGRRGDSSARLRVRLTAARDRAW